MKRAVAAFISAALIALLLWQVDTAALAENLRATRWPLFAIAIALFIPQILTIAWRWKRLVTPFAPLPLGESIRLVLAGSTMNLVLPGKMGDLTKGWFLAKAGAVSKPLGLGVVVFEKMLDVAALAVFMLGGVLLALSGATGGALSLPLASIFLALAFGVIAVAGVGLLYFVPLKDIPGISKLESLAARDIRFAKLHRVITGSHSTMAALRARGSRRGEILLLSFAIWTLHLVQIYLFFLSLNAAPAPAEFLAMIPLAIFIGLVPISIAGFGTRDAALVALLPALPSSAVLAAAFYINLRYIIPAAAGIPFLARYATSQKSKVIPE